MTKIPEYQNKEQWVWLQGHGRPLTSSSDATLYMAVVNKSKKASDFIKANRFQEAEKLLREVSERQPSAGFDDVAVALTQHELGRVLQHLGALDEALELLTAALKVRERTDEASATSIALTDGNLTREVMAKVYEAKGECTKALAIRTLGKRICSNETCEALDYTDGELLACSRCKCVFYCGKTCQWQDWKSRHKALCHAGSQDGKDAVKRLRTM